MIFKYTPLGIPDVYAHRYSRLAQEKEVESISFFSDFSTKTGTTFYIVVHINRVSYTFPSDEQEFNNHSEERAIEYLRKARALHRVKIVENLRSTEEFYLQRMMDIQESIELFDKFDI